MKYRLVLSLMLTALILFATIGCASNKGTVGTTYRQNNTEVTNAPPINMKVDTPTGAITDSDGKVIIGKDGNPVVPVESLSTSGTGPAGLAVSNGKESRAIFNNALMRNAFLQFRDLTLNSSSGSDLSAAADSIKFTDNGVEIRNFRFSTSGADLFRASNESLTALKEVFLKQTEEQRAVFIKQLETQQAAGGIAGDFAGNLLKYLLAP